MSILRPLPSPHLVCGRGVRETPGQERCTLLPTRKTSLRQFYSGTTFSSVCPSTPEVSQGGKGPFPWNPYSEFEKLGRKRRKEGGKKQKRERRKRGVYKRLTGSPQHLRPLRHFLSYLFRPRYRPSLPFYFVCRFSQSESLCPFTKVL